MSVYQDIISFGDHTSVATIVTDSRRRIEFVNDAFTLLCGHEKHEVLGKSPAEILQGPETSEESKFEIRKALQYPRPFTAKILNYHKDLHTYITGLYVLPFQDDTTESDYFLALERELSSWDEGLLDCPRFAKGLADVMSILLD